MRILLLEDDPAFGELVQIHLHRAIGGGVEIVHEIRLTDAVTQLDSEHFDVALVDLHLPDSAGIGTVRTVHAAAPTLPIVVLTSQTDDELGLRALRAGAEDYLQKDEVDRPTLRRVLRHAMERRRLSAQLHRVLSSHTDAVLVVGPDYIVRFANAAAQRLLSRTAETLVGGPLELPSPGPLGETTVTKPDGERLSVEVDTTPVLWDDAPCTLLTLRDITLRKRYAELSRYHSPDVFAWIVAQDGAEPAVRSMEATVLFADIVGFTTLAERLAPLDLAELLSAALGALTEVVFTHHGTLDKFLGDGLMAVFGAPLPRPDHAAQAVAAALSMGPALRGALVDGGLSAPLELRVGVNSGQMFAGRLGTPQRLEFTVLGDTVNVASRLCELCPGGDVLIGADTHEHLGGAFPCEPAGSRRLRNRIDPVETFRIAAR